MVGSWGRGRIAPGDNSFLLPSCNRHRLYSSMRSVVNNVFVLII